jgi:choline dehydrogenase-like flavoprotein
VSHADASLAFDYLILGGGTAGCVLANRLSEDPSVTVAVVEAGDGGDSAWLRVPALSQLAMRRVRRRFHWPLRSVEQPGLNGRSLRLSCGLGLGGSSAIGDMVYARPHADDFDHWASLGNPGWSSSDLQPFFERAERGIVSELRTGHPWHAVYREAIEQAGLPWTDGALSAQSEAAGLWRVTQQDGERCSAAHAHLHPVMAERGNLVVFGGARALRLQFGEGKRVVGAEVLPRGARAPVSLSARREVLLCAGALHSPHLLQVSGIGDGAALQKTGIRLRHHLPGVGLDLQDRLGFSFGHRVADARLFGLSLAGLLKAWQAVSLYRHERRGPFASNVAEGGAMLALESGASKPQVQFDFKLALVDDVVGRWLRRPGITLRVAPLSFASRGQVVAAGPDPHEPPAINPAYLGDPADMDQLLAACRLGQRLLQAPALASRLTRDVFTGHVRNGLELREAIRDRAESLGEFAGTCRMGSDELAVVDAQLKVRGVAGLRVVDASVMPRLAGGGMLAATLVLAEKAAALVRGEHGAG